MWNGTHFPKCPSGGTCVCHCPRKAHSASGRARPLRRACPHSSALQNLLTEVLRTYHHHQAPRAPWIPTWPLRFWTMTKLSVMRPSSSVLGVQVPARSQPQAGSRRGTKFPSRGKPSLAKPSIHPQLVRGYSGFHTGVAVTCAFTL